jgi:hypothetical protein
VNHSSNSRGEYKLEEFNENMDPEVVKMEETMK